NLKFIDLFSGIGGFHLAFHNLGCECVFASEIDKFARMTYQENMSKISPQLFDNNMFAGDIQEVDAKQIPDFNILCAGFPCQPFSQIGYKNGFADKKDNRGNMFFEIVKIIKDKKPEAFFLENVRNLEKHDDGKTFSVIKNTLEDLGYSFHYKLVRASDYGLPQHRPRLFMVGFKGEETKNSSFAFPDKKDLKYTLSDIFNGKCDKDVGFTLRVGGRGSKIDDRRNWEFYRVDGEVRRLTSKEGRLMQGFPDHFNFPVSEVQAMKQLGNSVAISAIQSVAKSMIEYINFNKASKEIKDNKALVMKLQATG
ncbi:DNA cytosine methyltransferase, partial [Flavobacteriaceae bacterium]|nr:DNA cytosine methyltransferase [Flavobacteriaceae bacterium]